MTEPMTSAEYVSALETLNLTVPECARFFGISRATAYRWAQDADQHEIHKPIAMWLRYMVRAKIPPSEVQWILSKPRHGRSIS